MTSGTQTGDSLPTNLHSPATPKAVTVFRSYAEYLEKLGRLSGNISGNISGYACHDELWLASFDEDGRCTKWNYCDTFPETMPDAPRNLPALDGRGVRPDTTSLSCDDFQTVLRSPGKNVAYRVVIVNAGYDGISPPGKDILGLGLDLRPDIFEYTQIVVENPHIRRHGVLPRPWHKVPPALRVGQNALCILEARPEEAPKTGIRNFTV